MTRSARHPLALVLLGVALTAPRCDLVPPQLVQVAEGLDAPVLVTAPPGDPRLFVVEQPGRVRILGADGRLRPTPFLDLSGRVSVGPDQGLLGLAFSPDYARDGEFYAYYTDAPGDSVLSRFRVGPDPDRADPGFEHELLRVAQPETDHNGGTVAFSPDDGMLYLGLGDGGGAGDPHDNAQDPGSLLGKMLRLDVGALAPGPKDPARDATVPPDNPFVGDPAFRPEIWALGLRNPFRFSFDRRTGDLWIGDEGQSRIEEVDFEPSGDAGGRNYGWPVQEGHLCYRPDPARGLPCESWRNPVAFVFPVHTYNHARGCAVVGGHVYRGPTSWLEGWYVFGDACSRRIWLLEPVTGATVEMTQRLRPPGGLASLLSFGEGGYGELYLTDLAGRVFRIETRADRDGDGVLDRTDNCPDARNGDQRDLDGDGVGDVCQEEDEPGPPPVS